MPTVYIETTIPSFYFETRRSPSIIAWRDATRMWWDHHRAGYSLCTSGFVLAELERAPGPKAGLALDIVSGIKVLDDHPRLDEVVAYYVAHRLMPEDARGDAAHLAMASLHGIDFLLTWNCRHLANMNKAEHVRVLNARLGLKVPTLTTPLTLMPETES